MRLVGCYSLYVGCTDIMWAVKLLSGLIQHLCGLLQAPGGTCRRYVGCYNIHVDYCNLYGCYRRHVWCYSIYVVCTGTMWALSLLHVLLVMLQDPSGLYRRGAVAAAMWAITASMWAVTASMWTVIGAMRAVQRRKRQRRIK